MKLLSVQSIKGKVAMVACSWKFLLNIDFVNCDSSQSLQFNVKIDIIECSA